MVCVPCIFIPVLLFLWRLFVQPLFLKFVWNPWAKNNDESEKKAPEFPFTCAGGVCSYNPKKSNENTSEVKDKKDE
uniref:Putative conserved secreted protein n=1 Tax=Xenopsylla cheopis TaxID=163159 RepID=A0A6M2E080_XENCH